MRVRQRRLVHLAFLFTVMWFLGVGLAALSHYFSRSQPPAPLTHESVRTMVSDLQLRVAPNFQLKFATTLGSKQENFASQDLLDPLQALPQAYRFERINLAELAQREEQCLKQASPSLKPAQSPLSPIPRDPAIAKYSIWVNYLCSGSSTLPANFLEREPHTHPLGGSWAQRLWRSERIPKDYPAIPPLRFLHLLEAAEWGLSIPGFPAGFLQISPENLRDLLAGFSLVIGEEWVYLRNDVNQLSAYSRAQWNELLRKNGLELRPAPNDRCDLVEQNQCWSRIGGGNPRVSTWLLVASIIILACWVAFLAWRRWAEIRAHRLERDLMIQTLAHELRHPAASIQLSLESFRREFDGLPDLAKDEFLRMTDQVQRLNRIIHMSKNYLQSNSEEGQGFRFHFESIDSVYGFVEKCLAPYEGKLQLELRGQDIPASLDPYWTSLCITNLVKNALIHGKQPIFVTLEPGEQEIKIIVADAGETSLSLDEMLQPFRKRDASPGMGLGLSLVHRISSLFGGRLDFQPKPTRFILTLPSQGEQT